MTENDTFVMIVLISDRGNNIFQFVVIDINMTWI